MSDISFEGIRAVPRELRVTDKGVYGIPTPPESICKSC